MSDLEASDLDVFELAAAGMVVTDLTGQFRRVNAAFATMLDLRVEDLVGRPFASFTSPEDLDRSQRVLLDLVSGATPTARFEKRYLKADGSQLWVDLTVRVLADADGGVTGFLTHASDISGRKAVEDELRQQAMLFNASFDAVFVCDAEGALRDCNPAAERLTGYSRAELLDRDGAVGAEWVRRMRGAMAMGGWSGDLSIRRGVHRRIAETTMVVVRGRDDAVIGGIAVCQDVTDVRRSAAALAKAEHRARYEAGHDPLTGLPNRKALTDHFLDLADGASADSGMALLMIDLDRFKEVNDTLGHHCGDELLIQVGQVLRNAVRDDDTVARLGGDEFAVLLRDVTRIESAMTLADRVREALEQPFRVQGVDLDVEASIGVALADGAPELTSVLRQADVAMYVAKRQGLGVFAYDPSADDNSLARLSLLGELRAALSRGELVLYFQPKVSLLTGEIVGAEALARWQHAERGLIPPDEFIPLAEHTGLIRGFTQYVLDAALAEERRWIDRGRPLPVSVNLSARNLQEDRLEERIIELLRRHDVPPTLLELEITESSIVTDPVHARDLLGRLRAHGIRISIDDFGAGYTSLAVLKNLPVSELKIDRSFIQAMAHQPGDALIVRSVVQLSHNLGLVAVAEGVEDEDALRALSAVGCDVVQGYHFSRPLPPEAFAAWCARHGDGTGAIAA